MRRFHALVLSVTQLSLLGSIEPIAWAASPHDLAETSTLESPRSSDPSPASIRTSRTSQAAPNESGYLDRFWLVDPRIAPSKPNPDLLKFELHGDYQLRYTQLSQLPLANYGFADYRERLDQHQRLEHWMRFNPRLTYRDSVSVVGQFDVPYGMLVGASTDHVGSDPVPLTDAQPMRFKFRWLYAEYRFALGRLRIGQQPAHWGLGLVYNTGDERQVFGDTRLGTIVERVSLVATPFGSNTPMELLLAADWVYADGRMSWLDGDRALRSTAGLSYVGGPHQRIGLIFVAEKLQPHFANTDLSRLRPTETTATFDLAGETALPVPGQPAYITAAGEAAMGVGRTDIAPEVLAGPNARVQRFGAVARLGAVVTRGAGSRRWGKWGIQFEWGYASGDADPSDGVDRRFVSNPSRRVGLILFDEILRWKSARAGTALDDPRVGVRPIAANYATSTAGGVAGATYLSLQWLYRPMPNFDLRAGGLLAQTAADLVDPARLIVTGRWSNFDGGQSSHRDLGLELDFATEYRQPLDHGLGLSLGVEGGLLFPGRALADDSANGIGTQGLVRGRFGFYL